MKKQFLLSSPSDGVYDVLMRLENDDGNVLRPNSSIIDLVILSFSDLREARELVNMLEASQKIAKF